MARELGECPTLARVVIREMKEVCRYWTGRYPRQFTKPDE